MSKYLFIDTYIYIRLFSAKYYKTVVEMTKNFKFILIKVSTIISYNYNYFKYIWSIMYIILNYIRDRYVVNDMNFEL